MKKHLPIKIKLHQILGSQKGDAMILISIVITGLVVLVSTVALENLRKSVSVQGLQQKSLENLYKAEEGIEYSLFINKNKELIANQNLNFNNNSSTISENKVAFNLTLFEESKDPKEVPIHKKVDSDAVSELAGDTVGRKIVLVSESAKSNVNDNTSLKRTLFANLPSRYYDQSSLGNTLSDCQKCQVEQNDTDQSSGTRFETILKTNRVFPGVNLSQISYRLTVNCGGSGFLNLNRKCEVQDLKIGLECGEIDSPNYNCPSSSSSNKSIVCNKNFSVNFNNEKNIASGYGSVSTIRFKAPSGIDLREKTIVIRLKLNEGKLATLKDFCRFNNSCTKTKMCTKKDSNPWLTVRDKNIYIGFDVSKKGDGRQLTLDSN